MRLRDTRMHCVFGVGENPIILRESCWREATFQVLSSVSFSSSCMCVCAFACLQNFVILWSSWDNNLVIFGSHSLENLALVQDLTLIMLFCLFVDVSLIMLLSSCKYIKKFLILFVIGVKEVLVHLWVLLLCLYQ